MRRRLPHRILALTSQSTVKEDVVVKKYTCKKSLIWFFASLLVKGLYDYSVFPRERLAREAAFFMLRNDTPKLIYIKKNTLVREKVPGKSLSLEDAELLGRLIAKVHSQGWVLGDTKFDNFIVHPSGRVYLIDGEQAKASKKSRERAIDLVVAWTFLSIFDPLRCNKRVCSFLRSYLSSGGDRRAISYMLMHLGSLLLLLFTCPLGIRCALKLCREKFKS